VPFSDWLFDFPHFLLSLLYLGPKTPYLCTLALTKFLLEFLLFNPSVWADKDAFVLPKLEIEIERRLQGKISQENFHF
jgi:hypothetical protein